MMKKPVALMLMTALMLALLAGCGGGAAPSSAAPASEAASSAAASSAPASEAGAPADGSVTVTDMLGQEATIQQPVESIVALTASDCEILYALGVGDKLVGRGEFCDYPAEVLDVAALESGNETNVEEIMALAPEVVFMSSMAQGTGPVEQLQTAGIPVVVSEGMDIAGTYTSIELIGKAVGEDEAAAGLVADMKQGFEELAAAIPESAEKPTVYFEVSPLEYGLWAAGKNTFMDEIANMLGMENIFADVDSWAEVSEEQVLERNPDYIISVGMYFGDGPTPDEEVLSRPGWQDVAAVQNGKVLHIGDDSLSRPGPRLVDGAKELFNYVYA